MKKHWIFIVLLLLATLLVIQGCTSGETEPTVATTEPAETVEPTVTAAAASESTELVLTLDELARYDGKNGNPAYIAVDSVIYDVTDISYWQNGDHNGFTAGNDLTEEIKNASPHGVSKLKGLPVVGKLAD